MIDWTTTSNGFTFRMRHGKVSVGISVWRSWAPEGRVWLYEVKAGPVAKKGVKILRKGLDIGGVQINGVEATEQAAKARAEKALAWVMEM